MYNYHCKRCGFTMDALSKYQRKVIKFQHRSKPCPLGIVVSEDHKGRLNYHITRAQIADRVIQEAI